MDHGSSLASRHGQLLTGPERDRCRLTGSGPPKCNRPATACGASSDAKGIRRNRLRAPPARASGGPVARLLRAAPRAVAGVPHHAHTTHTPRTHHAHTTHTPRTPDCRAAVTGAAARRAAARARAPRAVGRPRGAAGPRTSPPAAGRAAASAPARSPARRGAGAPWCGPSRTGPRGRRSPRARLRTRTDRSARSPARSRRPPSPRPQDVTRGTRPRWPARAHLGAAPDMPTTLPRKSVPLRAEV